MPSLFESDLENLREEAAGCMRCDLHQHATQTVFGEGQAGARAMFIGEQPGDSEDLESHPFVGPAGRLLDNALADAGIERNDAYVTNVVKHFKWTRAGKRRLHQKPNAVEIKACKPWLEQELSAVQPEVVVLLGATAAKALMGSSFRVTQQHGELLQLPSGIDTIATVHPSSILRAPDEAARAEAYDGFVQDLKEVAQRLAV